MGTQPYSFANNFSRSCGGTPSKQILWTAVKSGYLQTNKTFMNSKLEYLPQQIAIIAHKVSFVIKMPTTLTVQPFHYVQWTKLHIEWYSTTRGKHSLWNGVQPSPLFFLWGGGWETIERALAYCLTSPIAGNYSIGKMQAVSIHECVCGEAVVDLGGGS